MREGAKLFWTIVLGMAIVIALISASVAFKNAGNKHVQTIEDCKKERKSDYKSCMKNEIPFEWCYKEIIDDIDCI